MPTYLIHGFRWPRAAIRIHIIMNDLEDAAAEWIVAPASAVTFLNSFYTLYDFLPPSRPPVPSASSSNASSPNLLIPPVPPIPRNRLTNNGGIDSWQRKVAEVVKPPVKFNHWSVVKLLEHYDPNDESLSSQPYAYVADHMIQIALSADIAAEQAAYEENQRKELEAASSSSSASTTPRPKTAPGSNGAHGHIPSLSDRDMRRKSRRLGWLDKLRDQLAPEASIGWFVVVCGDEERLAPDLSELKIDGYQSETSQEVEISRPKTPRSAGLRSLFSRSRPPTRGGDRLPSRGEGR